MTVDYQELSHDDLREELERFLNNAIRHIDTRGGAMPEIREEVVSSLGDGLQRFIFEFAMMPSLSIGGARSQISVMICGKAGHYPEVIIPGKMMFRSIPREEAN